MKQISILSLVHKKKYFTVNVLWKQSAPQMQSHSSNIKSSYLKSEFFISFSGKKNRFTKMTDFQKISSPLKMVKT